MHRYENYAALINGMLMIRRGDVMYYDDKFFQRFILAIDPWHDVTFQASSIATPNRV